MPDSLLKRSSHLIRLLDDVALGEQYWMRPLLARRLAV
jgi:hypothetical protein